MIKIREKIECCGCGVCSNVCPVSCITMEKDEKGFFYPTVNQKECISCEKCQKVCPILNKKNIIDGKTCAYAMFNNDENERMNSSSGGIFSLLAKSILTLGGNVVGVVLSEDCYFAEYIVINQKSELGRLRGSKYLQSTVGDIYKQTEKILNKGNMVLFSGAPCHIEGLLNYLGKEYENLICVDIICHGVPTPELWRTHIQYIERKHHLKIKKVDFRCKKYDGYSEYGISYKGDREYYYSKEEDAYFQLFLNDLSLRDACYNCKFKGISRRADITLGDFWGIDDFVKEMNDRKGTSIVVAHSLKGQNALKKIESQVQMEEVDADLVFATHNESMTESVSLPVMYEEFWNEYAKYSYEELVRKYVTISTKDRWKSIFRKMGLLNIIRKIRSIK